MIALAWKYHKLPILLFLLSLIVYAIFAYSLERSNFPLFISLYSSLFALFYIIVQKGKTDFWLLTLFAMLLRLVFLPVIPNLSQDFYRFIWDGRMLLEGMNPYLYTPESFINSGQFTIVAQAQELYEGMGNLNGSHFTNYPPINQLCFAIAAIFSGKSIVGAAIVFRVLILIADIGTIILGKKLLQRMGLPIHAIFWYALNPFIIIEMTGNLHFESFMLFFVVWALYLLHKGKWFWGGVLLGISVSVKLLPLLLLPLFFQWFMTSNNALQWCFPINRDMLRSSIPILLQNTKKLVLFYLVVLGTIALTFTPFLTGEFANNFGTSIALWFQKFEFNASIYYLIRWYGFQTVGWNIIADVGPKLPIVVLGILLLITFLRKNSTMIEMVTAMLFSIAIYFLLSTTVHPWYAATPLILSVFTRYRFPLVWSFTIMLSYSAYGSEGFNEHLGFVALEYGIVIGYFIWEIWTLKKRPISP